MMMKYWIATGKTVGDLIKNVQHAIDEDGFKPFGSPTVSEGIWIQAMVKKYDDD